MSETTIPKDRLAHGAYYQGMCQNASVARWNTEVGQGHSFFVTKVAFSLLYEWAEEDNQ